MRKPKTEDQQEKASAWPAFLKSHAVLLNLIEQRFRAANLPSLEWYDVLWALEQAPEGRLRMWELANAVVISRSNLTRLIDRVAAQGLVERDRDLSDRRGAYAVLTPLGLSMRQKVWPTYERAIYEVFDQHLSRAETSQLRSLFARLLDAGRSQTEPPS